MATEPGFVIDEAVLRSMHFMVLDHDLSKTPGRYRTKEIFVRDDKRGINVYAATRQAVGLPHVRLHDLRHFYASGLIAAGCDVVTVQRALGHAQASTTLNTYSHLWPTAEDRTSAAAADLMREARHQGGER